MLRQFLIELRVTNKEVELGELCQTIKTHESRGFLLRPANGDKQEQSSGVELQDVICEKRIASWLVPEISYRLHVFALTNR